ncbi:reverse transcriptase domain-containing protein [Tanacetum coccineum]|uniref:Reverse transcriptase domain-containing protein n=1 Tax=Tanacetum coccineum TaxID=301880 RepID=A0ABQ5F3X3_9ASTR
MVPATAPLIGFSGEIIWPLGQISLLVKIRDEEHSTSAWMNFVIVRSSSLYNGIIGRPGIIPIECAAVSGPEGQPPAAYQAIEERIKMPLGLRNAGATYQRLVGKAFHKQIGRNLEVYMDDLVIKSRTEDERHRRNIQSPEGSQHEAESKKMYLRGRRRDVPRIQNQYQRNKEVIIVLQNLEKCTKKSDFHWTEEVESAFKQMKHLIAKLPTLTAPEEKEELIVYLAEANEAAHPIIVITDQPIKQVFSRPKVAGRLQKWSIELGEYSIHYRPRVSVKGQILADFIVERPEEDSPDTPMEVEEELPEPWILFTDRSSCVDGSGAGLILTNPEGTKFTYALRFRFEATNNEAEYEALIARLRIAE